MNLSRMENGMKPNRTLEKWRRGYRGARSKRRWRGSRNKRARCIERRAKNEKEIRHSIHHNGAIERYSTFGVGEALICISQTIGEMLLLVMLRLSLLLIWLLIPWHHCISIRFASFVLLVCWMKRVSRTDSFTNWIKFAQLTKSILCINHSHTSCSQYQTTKIQQKSEIEEIVHQTSKNLFSQLGFWCYHGQYFFKSCVSTIDAILLQTHGKCVRVSFTGDWNQERWQ